MITSDNIIQIRLVKDKILIENSNVNIEELMVRDAVLKIYEKRIDDLKKQIEELSEKIRLKEIEESQTIAMSYLTDARIKHKLEDENQKLKSRIQGLEVELDELKKENSKIKTILNLLEKFVTPKDFGN